MMAKQMMVAALVLVMLFAAGCGGESEQKPAISSEQQQKAVHDAMAEDVAKSAAVGEKADDVQEKMKHTFSQAKAPLVKAGEKITIAVIPKGTTHEYWNSVKAGAEKASSELGVKMIWKGPLKENDRAGQIQVVQQFLTGGEIDGMVIAPLDSKALVRPIQHAVKKGIPVVIIDSALDGKPGEDYVSFVATDNFNGGQLGGKELDKLIGDKGNVVLLRYLVGSASTEQREAGFLDVMHKTPGVKVLVDNRYAGATAGDAKIQSLNMIDRVREADGIFASNEAATLGMLLALKQVDLAGKKKFVGFDSSPPLVRGLKEDQIDALVVQNPKKMGYEGVKTLVAYLKGQKVAQRIDTGVAIVTKANLNDPEIKEMIE